MVVWYEDDREEGSSGVLFPSSHAVLVLFLSAAGQAARQSSHNRGGHSFTLPRHRCVCVWFVVVVFVLLSHLLLANLL